MKRTAILTLFAALLSFGAAGLAAAEDCTCKRTPQLSGPTAITPSGLRPGIDVP
jgi:hypothetical protein